MNVKDSDSGQNQIGWEKECAWNAGRSPSIKTGSKESTKLHRVDPNINHRGECEKLSRGLESVQQVKGNSRALRVMSKRGD